MIRALALQPRRRGRSRARGLNSVVILAGLRALLRLPWPSRRAPAGGPVWALVAHTCPLPHPGDPQPGGCGLLSIPPLAQQLRGLVHVSEIPWGTWSPRALGGCPCHPAPPRWGCQAGKRSSLLLLSLLLSLSVSVSLCNTHASTFTFLFSEPISIYLGCFYFKYLLKVPGINNK